MYNDIASVNRIYQEFTMYSAGLTLDDLTPFCKKLMKLFGLNFQIHQGSRDILAFNCLETVEFLERLMKE